MVGIRLQDEACSATLPDQLCCEHAPAKQQRVDQLERQMDAKVLALCRS